MKTQKLAAIDIGSNSLKLVIVEAAASDSFTVLLQDRERVRLGHETLRNKFLSAEAVNLSAEAIAKFRSIVIPTGFGMTKNKKCFHKFGESLLTIGASL